MNPYIQLTTNPQKKIIYTEPVVVIGFKTSIQQTFDVLLKERGMKYADFYNQEGLLFNKSYACHIRKGSIIPPDWIKIKIARAFGVDSRVIWE